jgi:hypothetical protein
MANKSITFTPLCWLAAGLIGFITGLAGGALAVNQLMKAPLQQLSLTTPALVLDRTRLIRALPPNATKEQMATAVEDWQRLSKRLSNAGFIVLDGAAVLTAPEDTYVRPEEH